MLKTNQGNSLIMWVVVFAVVISATMMFIAPVKRGITAKILRTTDFALWGIWGDVVKEDGGRNPNQIGEARTKVNQSLVNKNLENKGMVRTILNADSGSFSSYSSY